MRLTTVITELMCRSRKRTQFIVTDMSHFGALKLSTNTVCSYTSSRLCLCQAVLLLAQQYTMHLTTVITASRYQRCKQTQFITTDMSHFGAFKHSINVGVFLHYLETVLVLSSTTACTALCYAFDYCCYSAEMPQ
jgi:hypothetical protein